MDKNQWSDKRTPAGKVVTQYLLFGEVSFFVTLFICLALIPTTIVGSFGVSFYGNYKLTVFPYALGLLLSSYFILKAAQLISHYAKRVFRKLAEALDVLALLILGIVLTPYSIDSLFNWTHVAVSFILFALELLIAVWLMTKMRRDALNYMLLGMIAAGCLMALLSFLRIISLMLLGQVFIQFAFGVILLRACRQLIQQETETSESLDLNA